MIVEVLEHYGAEITRSWGEFSIKCPFHDDRHCSASVNLDKDLFNCFTCGVGGDAITLIRWREDCGYADAVRIAEGLAVGGDGPVSGGSGRESGYGLPRKSGSRGRRRSVPSWVRG